MFRGHLTNVINQNYIDIYRRLWPRICGYLQEGNGLGQVGHLCTGRRKGVKNSQCHDVVVSVVIMSDATHTCHNRIDESVAAPALCDWGPRRKPRLICEAQPLPPSCDCNEKWFFSCVWAKLVIYLYYALQVHSIMFMSKYIWFACAMFVNSNIY